MIVTSLDTITSTVAGCTIFGILGNLAYELGVEDISKVVKGGAGLAFVSYPDAIAKFSFMPQVRAHLIQISNFSKYSKRFLFFASRKKQSTLRCSCSPFCSL